MAKTKKELEEIKAKIDSLKETIRELSEEELDQVAGGVIASTVATGAETTVINFRTIVDN